MTDAKFPPTPVARLSALAALTLGLALAGSPAWAQFELAPQNSARPNGSGPRLSTSLQLKGVQSTADYILAVVNQEPVTFIDVERRVTRIIESSGPNARLPSLDELRRQVLDALIDEKTQVQFARTNGVNISDAEVDEAVASIAAQNQVSLAELKSRMQADGLDFARYRNSLREQITLERIRNREVNARISVSDAEADAFMAQQVASEPSVNVAQVLIAVPENATPAQVKALAAKAEGVRERAAAGVAFAALAKEFSADAATREQGGTLGMRPLSKLPDLFVAALKDLPVGQVAAVVRSGAGFHVLKLIERENTQQATYTQQRARHILLRANPQQSIQAATVRMAGIRKQIVDGQGSFAQLARQHSEDGSATKGGELGWASPGQFVPEFESALLQLQPGQLSEPVVSRFGVHLIQLIERREVALTEQQKREAAKSVIREQRFETTYEDWARELRAAAFVEMRDAP